MLQPYTIESNNTSTDIEYIRKGMAELPVRTHGSEWVNRSLTNRVSQSWEWTYSQTPEFTYNIKNTLAWGTVVSPRVSTITIITEVGCRWWRSNQNTVSYCHATSRMRVKTMRVYNGNSLVWDKLLRQRDMGLWTLGKIFLEPIVEMSGIG